MTSFAQMHDDYLDPDRHHHDYAWHLFRLDNGEEKILVDVFDTCDGQDVMGCDMHDWMVENEYYGNADPDIYVYDGDGESVAIMSKEEGHPDFRFEWIPVA
jgi:hypothetical protein